MVNTRSKRQLTNASGSGQAKRRRGRATQVSAQSPSRDDPNHLDPTARQPTASTSQRQPRLGGSSESERPAPQQSNLQFSDLTLANYESALDYWPMNRINKQLASQSSENEKLTAVVIAHAQAVLERFEQTLHMIAMISGCAVAVLKRRLGLFGGMHGENPWHRWLSFSLEAQKLPMPVRGDTNAGKILTRRNKANAAAYQNLSDDEYSVYTSPVFYALAGYPNYSAINLTDLENINLEEVLVPEVPQLSEVQEARYRHIYLQSVDLNKVKKDKELSTPAVSSSAIEKRSLQCFRKIATQLARDGPLVGLDYLFIACSKSRVGQGWCRVKTTQDEMLSWLNQETDFERLFPIYSQGSGTFAQIRQSLIDSKNSASKRSRPANVCDQVKGQLTARLNSDLIAVLGCLPLKKWPRGPNPIQALQDRQINVFVRRDPRCSLSDELWEKGYKGMETVGRKAWLKDYEDGLFELLPLTDPLRRTGPDHPGRPAGPEAGGSGCNSRQEATGGGEVGEGEVGGGDAGGGEVGGGEVGGGDSGGGDAGGGENSAGSGSGSGVVDDIGENFFSGAQIGAWA